MSDLAPGRLLLFLGCGLQVPFHGGDLAVQQLGRGVEVAVALGAFGLPAQFVELLLQLADPVEGLLLLLPAGGEAAQFLLLVGEVAAQLLQAFAGGGVGLLAEGELLHPQPVDGALEFVDLDGRRVDLHTKPGGGLVDEVDGLVGQEPGGDVPVGERGRGDQRAVRDQHLVMGLVPPLEPAQNRDRVLDGRLGDQHLLEAPLQRRVLLDALAVLVEGRGADHAQLTAGEHGLEHVARVHGGVTAGARAHDGVQLVDERDDLPVGVLDLGEHGLQPLLELTAVLRARDHRAEVERDQPLVLQRLGHVALDDALGEPFDDGGLADAGLADEDGVVLRTPGQHLHDAPDLLVPADDRVELALARGGGEVRAELLQCLVLALGIGCGHPAPSPCLLERVQQLLRRGPLLGEYVPGLAALRGDADEQVLGGEVLVARAPWPAAWRRRSRRAARGWAAAARRWSRSRWAARPVRARRRPVRPPGPPRRRPAGR